MNGMGEEDTLGQIVLRDSRDYPLHSEPTWLSRRMLPDRSQPQWIENIMGN